MPIHGRLPGNKQGERARMLVGQQLRYKLENGFPVITERDLSGSLFRGALSEHIAFLNGARTEARTREIRVQVVETMGHQRKMRRVRVARRRSRGRIVWRRMGEFPDEGRRSLQSDREPREANKRAPLSSHPFHLAVDSSICAPAFRPHAESGGRAVPRLDPYSCVSGNEGDRRSSFPAERGLSRRSPV